jgi:hypothetical protein
MQLMRVFPAAARCTAFLWTGVCVVCTAQGAQSPGPDFRPQFFQLCDLTRAQLQAGPSKDPFFIDSYAVRALCVAYDLTGKKEYLDACRAWSDRMLAHQTNMHPKGAYYMNYGRKPGEEKGGWYVADSSSIGMGVLATAVRCSGAEKQRFLDSAKKFAALVMDNYVGSGGGIRNGLWPKFDGEWWCSSGIFCSLAFLLYDETGDERYLTVALGAVDWLNGLDPEKEQPYPVSEMGPTYPMYVLEGYSAGSSHLKPGTDRYKAALARISWYLDWIAKQQTQLPRERQWPADVRWGMKFGGLPFHQYVQSRVLPDGPKLTAAGDREMARLASLVFTNKITLTQLPVFMMMSYAERVSPGAIYRNSHGQRAAAH